MFATAELLEMHRRMLVIRGFEERVTALYRDGEVPGFVHLSIGQEASAVGACWPLRPADVITSTHRGHGHCLAKGLDPLGMFAELMAKDQGTNRGRGGSMHIADPSIGIFGANGIVGAGLPIAVGAATAAQLRGDRTVAVAFFGDGAAAQGAFHEAINLAAVWRLPVIFFCENNGYAEFSPASTQHAAPLERRAVGYGADYIAVDGNDVIATAAAMGEVIDAIRAGRGPAIVEAATYRWRGHYEGDPERYRSPDEVAEWQARDPLLVHADRLRSAGISDEEIKSMESSVAEELDEAVEAARRLASPAASSLTAFVARPRPERGEPPVPAGDAPVFRTMDAIRAALEAELASDDRVFLAGIDVATGGNVFGLTRGLHDRFGDRVRDTPISETAIVGVGVGAAMAGMRPVVEVMYLDFVGVCLDQLLNQAAKLPFMTGGAAQMALTVRTQFGAGRSSGSQHSQSLEAMLAHIPGLSVVMPSTPADTYGLLRASIQDPNPVVFIENRLLYGTKGPQPPSDFILPIGTSCVVRPGTDVTVVSVSRMVHEALAAAESLAAEGISIEVIDLRTVAPLDMAPILESVHKTSRLLIAHEAVVPFGIGAEIAATVAREGFWDLDAPIYRVGAAATPPPYAPDLERAWLPDRDDIAEAIRRLAAARAPRTHVVIRVAVEAGEGPLAPASGEEDAGHRSNRRAVPSTAVAGPADVGASWATSRNTGGSVSSWSEPRLAVVTGGASGIGLAISERLADDGASVAIFDLNGPAAKAAAAKIEAGGGQAVGLEVDVTDRPRIEDAVGEVVDRLGAPLILVNNAGRESFVPFLDISVEHWNERIDINLTGTFHCCQVVLPHMLEAGWGRIVNISSSSTHSGTPRMAAYVAAKSGVIGLTKVLALEFAPSGITVNTIPPGFIDTPMLRAAAAAGKIDIEASTKTTPVRRQGRPEDIAAACSYLCRDEASYVTGQIIGVNGGRNT